jgi:hypothetical protein
LELTARAHQPLLPLRNALTRFRRKRLTELVALPGTQIQHFLPLLLAEFLHRLTLLRREKLTTPSGWRWRHRRWPAAPLRLPQSRHCREHRHREQPSSAVHIVSKVRAPGESRCHEIGRAGAAGR